MEQHNIPDFMQEYYQESDMEGRHRIERLAHQYSEEQAVFLQTIYVSKQEFLRDWNRRTGERKQLTAKEALAPMRYEYTEKAKQLAQDYSIKARQAEENEHETTNIKPTCETFLANLKSMRERQANQQIRPRH